MQFTYDSYRKLLILLQKQGYEQSAYHNWENKKRCVILRHDVDCDMDAALRMAYLENQWGGVKSTYFLLLTSDFYNVFSRENSEKINKIMDYGHEVGLHFDEMNYPELAGNGKAVCEKILQESGQLEKVTGKPVKLVSMHRPSRKILESNLMIPGMINSYGDVYFHDFKYLSDSRRHWREPVEEIIASGKYEKLHILTHPFWYRENEVNIHDAVKEFVNSANEQRYHIMLQNITDLETIMRKEEIS